MGERRVFRVVVVLMLFAIIAMLYFIYMDASYKPTIIKPAPVETPTRIQQI